MDFEDFLQDLSSLEIISKDSKKMSVKLKGVPLQYANALRRICLNGVPVFAVDTVDIIENSSVLPDEGLAHRLGLIPLKTDLSRFNEPSKCDCHSETGCSNCKVMLVLDSGESDITRTILSSDLSSEDDSIKPISDKIPIIQLAPGQKIKIECYARLGRGLEHAKWNSATISTLTNTDKENESTLTVESTGALEPEQIILSGVEEVNKKLGEFKDIINQIS
ncbi:MAG TPA: DNA-directed RNA polymerase subunit D [Nitrosopumilus sp.]|nr:DNA-directed RNA polymerase subunit D [Nitrosopumilus sp.]HJM25923.1 DNA-directed RNA polymerase subunit D [Nitrosopumilus sp.]HJO31735.1 DNA-directed RNA polymerase subunit D [Nitrosopumilus sp.]